MQASPVRLSSFLPRAAALHAVLLVCLCSWVFGGNDLALRPALLAFGSLSLPLAVLALLASPHRLKSRLLALLPLALFLLLGAISFLNPSLKQINTSDGIGYVQQAHLSWLPSSARPSETLAALWKFTVPYLTAFNLCLCVDSRRLLRIVLALVFANTVALALFGSVQKLTDASGLYFGQVPSPNLSFFASFIYHNHWGSFALLSLALGMGLAWWLLGKVEDLRHSLLPLLLCGALLIAAAIPLSTSRSCTFLLTASAALTMLVLVIQHRVSLLKPRFILLASLTTLGLGLAIGWLSLPAMEPRLRQTQEQVRQIYAEGSIGSRMTLYRDSYRLASQKPLFGWGPGCYPIVFYQFNSQAIAADRLPLFFADAHNDWLQSVAENGLAGTALIVLMLALPLWSIRDCGRPGRIPIMLFAGCAMIGLYALLEFPFGNLAVVTLWWLCFFSAIRYQQLCSRS